MTEARPSIAERYITADSGSEVVMAAGWVAQRHEMALMLWSVMYEGKTGQKHRLAELLGDHLNHQMNRDRRLKGNAWTIAKQMLAWWCEGICTACDGRGYEVIQGTPSLSDKLCGECHGTGKRPYTREAAHVWMEAELSRMTAIAAGEVMKRLRVDMEL
jgi:hypothetical protein